MLRDRFVAGTKRRAAKIFMPTTRGVSNSYPDGLLLDKAVETACNAETAKKNI